ncbi:glycolate oxidase subunit GlcF [Niveispirillum sp. KHB5.9]|uniref:glycolate oxidase subunit GlcF n=1 Tax=Niveispirillum sp. KHB5.9 TaxID=3400269 RepID=UPI003A83985F
MQTHFTLTQLADSGTAEAEKILRTCVHCGFCTATCPTYRLTGDERDSPRGRIYLIKDMLEKGRPAGEVETHHIDRCLSCLSCMTTCPSGVHYMHLVDHARAHIERTGKRPVKVQLKRLALRLMLPHAGRFRAAMGLAKAARPFRALLPPDLRAMLDLAPDRVHPRSAQEGPATFPAQGQRRMRVALLPGCVQPALDPAINAAAIRLLNRLGAEVVVAKGVGCCGALTHHMGHDGHGFATANIQAWMAELEGAGLDAIIVTASGCGTTVKDYGYMFREDADMAAPAAKVSALARDVTEVLSMLGLPAGTQAPRPLRVAYHAACSLQHGQKVKEPPRDLLRAAGFTLLDVPDGHLCCGSAGTYNLLQPEMAGQLRDAKVAAIESTRPDIIAAGNIGCMTQIGSGTPLPIVHTVQLLDWATGGPTPDGLT